MYCLDTSRVVHMCNGWNRGTWHIQEEIADDRNEVNRERIDVQRDAVQQRADTAATRSRRGFEP